ncbi:alpha-N-acetylgalactosaminide alpha-2,6-sialyltransferase 2-like isoform X1 [Dromaius novaehollandiae]|uniref:alpha-N-acetylgalactosaminide alpha-2,6-sialyltransferase 2-like isoform X1 n=1 Tax=Dromaius novaehollandiae TaxID=8790 RepID=UPI00311EFD71
MRRPLGAAKGAARLGLGLGGCRGSGPLPLCRPRCAMAAVLAAALLSLLLLLPLLPAQCTLWHALARTPGSSPGPGALRTAAPEQVTQPPRRAPVPILWPSLGDTYGQDKTYCSSKCPSSIRKRVVATEFKDIFLETIPVLQWARHAREEEYQRLRRYSGAHGWKGVSWEVLKASLSLLNTSANGFLFDARGRGPGAPASCVRCAVVGNGGILNGSRMGRAIDAHDYVFRVNGAITAGFERDVGSRTSFYVFSTNTMVNSLGSYAAEGFEHPPQTPETRYVFLPDHDRDYLLLWAALTRRRVDRGRDKGAWPQKYFGGDLLAGKFKMLHPDFIRYLRNRYPPGGTSQGPQPQAEPLGAPGAPEEPPAGGGGAVVAGDRGPQHGHGVGSSPSPFPGGSAGWMRLLWTFPGNRSILRLRRSLCPRRFLRADILATPQRALYRPSTGAVMLLAALHTCDEVSAFGFLTPDYAAYSDHYFDRTRKRVQFFANHDLRKEMELWQRLQRSGLLRLYAGRKGT